MGINDAAARPVQARPPGPGGLTSADLLWAVREVARRLELGGADLVEVIPNRVGTADSSALVADRIVREILTGIALRSGAGQGAGALELTGRTPSAERAATTRGRARRRRALAHLGGGERRSSLDPAHQALRPPTRVFPAPGRHLLTSPATRVTRKIWPTITSNTARDWPTVPAGIRLPYPVDVRVV